MYEGDNAMDTGIPFEIRFACEDEWENAMGLAWKTFLEFEASDYPPEGIRNFEDFITDEGLKRLFLTGNYPMLTAYVGKKLVGIITLRNQMHISLLFVDKQYHRCGIGRMLVRSMAAYVGEELGKQRMTVNASPYGVPFYHRVGFRDLGPEKQQDGIIYTPMEYLL